MTARITQGPINALGEGETETRITQAPVEVLGVGDNEQRITQLALYVLGLNAPPNRITQLPVSVLLQLEAAPRITQFPMSVLAAAIPCVSYLAQCWKVTRRDGESYTFTAHDRPIIFRGDTYNPCGAMNPSAYQASGQMKDVGNANLIGLMSLDSDMPGIPIADITAGLLDAAQVEIWEVPWQGDESPLPILKGYISKITQMDISYQAEILTQSGLLANQGIVENYTPNCRFMLGDARCAKPLAAFTESSIVSELAAGSAQMQSRKRQFFDAARIEADGYWANGMLTWTGGDNTGYSSEVAASFDNGAIILWNVMPHEIQLGDAYTIIAGCDKKKETCISKFSNIANFGGFPDIPGNDVIFQTPDAKQ